MSASAEFRLSITRALADQLVTSLASLSPESLTQSALEALPHRAGVYQLYLADKMVYVGKADPSLPKRLTKHFWKLSGRENVDIADTGFTCLFVDEDLHAVAPERLLIDRFKADGKAPWNFNGFGNNDPGQQRDTTMFDSEHFDMIFPAGLDWCCREIVAGEYSASNLLSQVKSQCHLVKRQD